MPRWMSLLRLPSPFGVHGVDGSASLACLAGSSDGTTSETMTDPLFPVRAALIPYPG